MVARAAVAIGQVVGAAAAAPPASPLIHLRTRAVAAGPQAAYPAALCHRAFFFHGRGALAADGAWPRRLA